MTRNRGASPHIWDRRQVHILNGLLAGRVALVLGAGSIGNIGQGIARRFALEGAQVMIAGRNALPLETLAWEIGASYELCDITHQSDLTRLTEQVVAKYGALSIAVNATGRNHLESFVEVTRAQIEEMTEVQFIGPFLFLQSIVRAMRALGQGGSIIHVSSVTSTLLLHRHALYMGTKAGIEQVVRSVAYDHGVDGIRINLHCARPDHRCTDGRPRVSGPEVGRQAHPKVRPASRGNRGRRGCRGCLARDG